MPGDVYGGTFRMLHKVFEPIGCVVTRVDFADLAALERAVTSKTKLVWLESPTNPRLLVYDIAAVSRIAHAKGALVVVDNTFATPFFQQPFALGADLIVHSVTKYLAGHSDLIQGAVIAQRRRDLRAGRLPAERARRRAEPVRLLAHAARPEDAGAADAAARGERDGRRRGARRVTRACSACTSRASRRIPGHDIARRQMTGFGGMVSFELDGTPEEAASLVSSFKYFALGESLGGVRALVCLPCRMTHASIPAETRAELGLSDTLIRLSTGCESPRDLVRDLVDGLDRLGAKTASAAREAVGV